MVGRVEAEVKVHVIFIRPQRPPGYPELNFVLNAVLDPDLVLIILDHQRQVPAELEVVQIIPEVEGLTSKASQLRVVSHWLGPLPTWLNGIFVIF
jgi:hypothetical protein